MSTRSTTHLMEGDQTLAIIYRHTDGYPEGHGVALTEFFEAVERATADTRYDDASYLAAKLVVWLTEQFSYGYEGVKKDRLDFLSVGVVMEDPLDIQYRYRIHCDDPTRPRVTCETTDGESVEIPAAA